MCDKLILAARAALISSNRARRRGGNTGDGDRLQFLAFLKIHPRGTPKRRHQHSATILFCLKVIGRGGGWWGGGGGDEGSGEGGGGES